MKRRSPALLLLLLLVSASAYAELPIKTAPPDVVLPDPPEQAPDNAFGYEQAYRGCLEGQVFALAPDTGRLPDDYSGAEPLSKVYACELNISPRGWTQGFPGVEDRFEWFAIHYAGELEVVEGGVYRLRAVSDDGVRITLDGQVALEDDSIHPPRSREVEVTLEAGWHPVVVEYFQGPRVQIALQLFMTPPRGAEQVLSFRPRD